MSSGVGVDDECFKAYESMKLRHAHQYIVYGLSKDLKKIEIVKLGVPGAPYDEFVEELREAEEKQECRYGVFDAKFVQEDGGVRDKLVFFLWSPENAKIKQKMLYTSSKDYLRRKLVGIGKEVQATDYAELAWTNVLEKLMS